MRVSLSFLLAVFGLLLTSYRVQASRNELDGDLEADIETPESDEVAFDEGGQFEYDDPEASSDDWLLIDMLRRMGSTKRQTLDDQPSSLSTTDPFTLRSQNAAEGLVTTEKPTVTASEDPAASLATETPITASEASVSPEAREPNLPVREEEEEEEFDNENFDDDDDMVEDGDYDDDDDDDDDAIENGILDKDDKVDEGDCDGYNRVIPFASMQMSGKPNMHKKDVELPSDIGDVQEGNEAHLSLAENSDETAGRSLRQRSRRLRRRGQRLRRRLRAQRRRQRRRQILANRRYNRRTRRYHRRVQRGGMRRNRHRRRMQAYRRRMMRRRSRIAKRKARRSRRNYLLRLRRLRRSIARRRRREMRHRRRMRMRFRRFDMRARRRMQRRRRFFQRNANRNRIRNFRRRNRGRPILIRRVLL